MWVDVRLILKTLLGITLTVDKLHIQPCIPDHWDSFKMHYRYSETVYHISVKCVGEKNEKVVRMTLDGRVVKNSATVGAV